MEEVQRFDRRQPPAQTIRGAHIYRSEKGQMQAELTADLIVKYTEPVEQTIFPHGLKVTFFDSLLLPKAFFTADSAIQWNETNEFRAYNNVVLIDHRSHDTVYLEDIIWDSREKRIYSDHPLHAVNGQRVTYGDRFESDDSFTNPQIVHQRGSIEWDEEEEEEP